jgi:hypothetical protein
MGYFAFLALNSITLLYDRLSHHERHPNSPYGTTAVPRDGAAFNGWSSNNAFILQTNGSMIDAGMILNVSVPAARSYIL